MLCKKCSLICINLGLIFADMQGLYQKSLGLSIPGNVIGKTPRSINYFAMLFLLDKGKKGELDHLVIVYTSF
jgi:hypothetical protein